LWGSATTGADHERLTGSRQVAGQEGVSTAAPLTRSAARSDSARSAASSRIRRDRHPQPVRGRGRQQIAPVLAGVRGDAAKLAFLEQVARIVQRRDVAQVNAGYRQGAAPVERGQRHRHQLTNRREQDRRVQRLRGSVVRPAG
jgi:hypothetical protein